MLSYVVFLLAAHLVNSFISSPNDAVIGYTEESLALECDTNHVPHSQSLTWSFTQAGFDKAVTLYFGGMVINPWKSRYHEGHYTLFIPKVDKSYAGRYSCYDETNRNETLNSNEVEFIELIVIESLQSLVCRINSSDASNTSHNTLQCSIGYAGNVVPEIVCFQDGVKLPSNQTQIINNGSQYISTLALESYQSKDPSSNLRCEVHFKSRTCLEVPQSCLAPLSVDCTNKLQEEEDYKSTILFALIITFVIVVGVVVILLFFVNRRHSSSVQLDSISKDSMPMNVNNTRSVDWRQTKLESTSDELMLTNTEQLPSLYHGQPIS